MCYYGHNKFPEHKMLQEIEDKAGRADIIFVHDYFKSNFINELAHIDSVNNEEAVCKILT